MSQEQRRLAAIMFTDMVGFTALTQSDEAQSLEVVERHNRLLRPFFPKFNGREVKAIGDSFLVEFDSALDATRCAVEVQTFLHDYNFSSRDEWKITLRIGIHLGDVVPTGGDIMGDAVNIAARLQPLAEPEGICVSDPVYGQVRNKIPEALVKLEPRALKGVRFPVDVYKVVMPWEKGGEGPRAGLDSRRIAILPFSNLSTDPADLYFADGMTEEIISAASGISGLSVISRTSVMGYKGTTKKVGEIGKELQVGSVLEGSFRKAGNKIRITTQLVNANDDSHVWSQNYDKELNDVFDVQSDIARKVAEALRVRILAPEEARLEKKPTESTEAYTLYLKGRSHWNRRVAEELQKAVAAFEQAVAIDQGFALGYVGLADCYRVLGNNYGVDSDANMERSKKMLARALEVEPDLAEARASSGNLRLSNYETRESEEELRAAIALKPSNATAHHWLSLVLVTQMRLEEALSEMKKAVELSPLSPVINQQLGWVYQAGGEYEKAIGLYRRAVELDPAFDIPYFFMFSAYIDMKRPDDARRAADLGLGLRKQVAFMDAKLIDAVLAAARGDGASARALLPEIEARFAQPGIGAFGVAEAYFILGDYDKAFEWSEKAFSRREWYLLFIRNRRFADPVRDDPRYKDLLRRLGVG